MPALVIPCEVLLGREANCLGRSLGSCSGVFICYLLRIQRGGRLVRILTLYLIFLKFDIYSLGMLHPHHLLPLPIVVNNVHLHDFVNLAALDMPLLDACPTHSAH
eukprot:GDKJ01063662.1.p2 GENE.GDKJ01063662.1~~GDKJ01063662.1.p2  ORF type:complete len:105 (+),score=0.22 GDKJ01063662.1:112-426(+)